MKPPCKYLLQVALVVLLALAAGCATGNLDPNYAAYLKAAAREPKPLLRIVAQPGRQITGLQSIEVYAPAAGRERIAPYRPAPHPVWGVLGAVVRVGGQVGGVWAAGEAARSLARAVGESAGHDTTITGIASGTQSGVAVTPGAASSARSQPTDTHHMDSHDSGGD